MAAPDSTVLKSLIDSNIPDATPTQQRKASASFVRFALKAIIDWVTSSINGNLSTWWKLGTSSSALLNSDDVYRTGKVIIGRTTDDGSGGKLVVNGKLSVKGGSLHGIKIDNTDGQYPPDYINEAGNAQLTMGANWIPGNSDLAFMNSNIAGGGFSFWKILTANTKRILAYMTANGDFIIGGTAPAERFHVEGNAYITGIIKQPATIANRKIVLYEGTANDHQFYGFGVNGGILRYQVNSITDTHVFYAGLSPATSKEVMRIQGDGKVGIGVAVPVYQFEVGIDNPLGGVIGRFSNVHGYPGCNGALISLNQSGLAVWLFGQPAGVNAFVIQGWLDGVTYPERLRIDANGFVGIGTAAPTSMVHAKGTTGHQQLRLETDYTPTSSSDTNGAIGQICFDANYCYKKSAAGWKRSPIFTTF